MSLPSELQTDAAFMLLRSLCALGCSDGERREIDVLITGAFLRGRMSGVADLVADLKRTNHDFAYGESDETRLS